MSTSEKPVTVADVLIKAFNIKAPPPCPECGGFRLKGCFAPELYCLNPDCDDYWEKVKARRQS